MKLAIRLLINLPVFDHGPLAQLAEQVTLNHPVAGSSPARLTTHDPKGQGDTNQQAQFLGKRAKLLKNQPAKRGQAGFLFASRTKGRGYNGVTDNASEPRPTLTAPHETAFPLKDPLTLPEYVVEVLR